MASIRPMNTLMWMRTVLRVVFLSRSVEGSGGDCSSACPASKLSAPAPISNDCNHLASSHSDSYSFLGLDEMVVRLRSLAID